jgi:hypothetical protein
MVAADGEWISSNLRDDVSDIEQRDARRPFDIGHSTILLHTGEAGVGDIDAIQVAVVPVSRGPSCVAVSGYAYFINNIAVILSL